MHVTLSDLLVCPRCGPDWGLILLPETVRDRRVETGVLGCPNCSTRYGIRDGVAALAVGAPLEPEAPWRPEDGATRLAAVLGLAERRGVVLLAGSAAAHGPAVAALTDEVEVVVGTGSAAADPPRTSGEAESRVSRIELGEALPIRTGALSGIGLTGAAAALASEAARALGPGARLLVEPAGPEARRAVEAAGLRLLVEESDALLAVR